MNSTEIQIQITITNIYSEKKHMEMTCMSSHIF